MPPKSAAAAASTSTLTSPTAPSNNDPHADPTLAEDDAPESDPERAEQEVQAYEQQHAVMQGLGELDLPKTVVTKLAKGELAESAKLQQDVVLGLIKSATVFISYLAAAAHDQTTSSNRKNITPQDVLDAVRTCGFEGVVGKDETGGLGEVLERELVAYRALHSTSKRAAPAAGGAATDPTAGPSSKKGKTPTNNFGRSNGRKSTGSASASGSGTGAAPVSKGAVQNGNGVGRQQGADLMSDDEEEEERGERVAVGAEAEDEETERARRAVGADEDDMDVDGGENVNGGKGTSGDGDEDEAMNGPDEGEEEMDKGLQGDRVGGSGDESN